MRQPPISPLLGPPIAGNPHLADAAQGWETPKRDGSEASWTEKKIRAGTQPPCPALAGMMDRHASNGGTIDGPRAFVLALLRAVHERWNVSVSALDLDAAVALETEAEGAANRFDMRACVWRTLSLADKKAYEQAAWADAYASDARARAVTAQIQRDELETELARARMFETRRGA